MESSTGKDFKIGECQGQKVVDGEVMPLVLLPPEPAKADTESLLATLKKNPEWFEQMIIKNSAVLLRGFDVKNAEDFNEIVEACGWEDMRYFGPAPRTNIYKRVWTANEGPLSEFLFYHHEMILFKENPKKVILFCEVPPPEGGETPFVPSFRVTERMLEEFPKEVEEMEKKGLMYTFTASSTNNTSSIIGRGWRDAFGTLDPARSREKVYSYIRFTIISMFYSSS
ncbi:clavaminate synthase-like protein At3g21360 [Eucalyptus grandis]|uniref:clavaminate synthase-like protein At3g21360 n=1 Tax=Eucalyptus grandis TaxID=71139 RepID=UPI00192EB133|nr:clavaminate synthase-like protein At3g21360 [Eucalyptus grandis]